MLARLALNATMQLHDGHNGDALNADTRKQPRNHDEQHMPQ